MMRTNIRITKLMTRLTALEREQAEIIYCLVNSQGMAMADRQSTNRFGIDPAVLGQLDWALAKNRILADIRSDFIYAPHISNVSVIVTWGLTRGPAPLIAKARTGLAMFFRFCSPMSTNSAEILSWT